MAAAAASSSISSVLLQQCLGPKSPQPFFEMAALRAGVSVLSVVLRLSLEEPGRSQQDTGTESASALAIFPGTVLLRFAFIAAVSFVRCFGRGQEPCSHRLERCSTAPSKPSHGKAALVQGQDCLPSTWRSHVLLVLSFRSDDMRMYARTSDFWLQVEMARIKALKQMEEAGRQTRSRMSSSSGPGSEAFLCFRACINAFSRVSSRSWHGKHDGQEARQKMTLSSSFVLSPGEVS